MFESSSVRREKISSIFFFFFVELVIELRALCLLGKCSTSRPYFHFFSSLLFRWSKSLHFLHTSVKWAEKEISGKILFIIAQIIKYLGIN
jgi:hypothetical protein